jgi:nucleoside-diphosphate-sugar epimerase
LSVRILLTGASGFVGHHSAIALAAAGHDLRLLARPSSDLSALADVLHQRIDVDLHQTDPGAFAPAFAGSTFTGSAPARDGSGIDAVVHVAGLTVANRAADFDRVNAQGTAALARAAADAGVTRFLYISSLAALGPSIGGVPAHPESPRRPISDYGRSKAAGEEAVLREADGRNGAMSAQILRPPVVYGPHDVALLPFFQMARWRYITRIGDGYNRVSAVYGPDLADAIAALVAEPDLLAEPPGPAASRPRIFHISDADGPYDWRSIIDAVTEVFGHRLLTVPVPPAGFAAFARASVVVARLRKARPMLDPSRVQEMRQRAWLSDNAVLTAATGWTPKTSLRDGLADTLRWYREHGWV